MTQEPTFDERVERLVPLTAYGPTYNRLVRESLLDAKREQDRDNEQYAERWLLKAEMHAKVITFEEYQVLIAQRVEGKLL